LTAASPAIFEATLPPEFSADDAKSYRGFRLVAAPGAAGFSQLRERYDGSLWLLLGVAGLVLLIACANLANLLLARMSAREREMAVRLAIGASRGRLIQQLLIESLMLAAIGTVAGALLAPVVGHTIVGLISSQVDPMFVDLTPDWRVIGFLASLGVLTTLLFGLAPALRATRVPPDR
jgi:ABC-type antimicrobial peptide transport system permease subunit